jgi:hypothetical protein
MTTVMSAMNPARENHEERAHDRNQQIQHQREIVRVARNARAGVARNALHFSAAARHEFSGQKILHAGGSKGDRAQHERPCKHHETLPGDDERADQPEKHDRLQEVLGQFRDAAAGPI